MAGWERTRVVPFAPGLALAQPLLVPWPLNGEEHVANIEVGVADGQPACVAIHSAHGQPLTGRFVRSLPLSQIVTAAADRNTYPVFRTRRGKYIGVYYSDAFEGMLGFGDGLEELRNDVRRKRRTLNDEFLSEVAAVYRDARARRIPTTKAVQEHFGPTTPRTLAGGSLCPRSRATRCRGRTRPGWRTDHDKRSHRWLDRRPARWSSATASAGGRSRCASAPTGSAAA